MATVFFSDFAQRFRSEISTLSADAAGYQTFDLAMELLVERTLVSFVMKRKKGVDDSLFYRRDMVSGKGMQIDQGLALKLFDHFLSLPEHIALAPKEPEFKSDGFADAVTANWQFPACAVEYMFRRRGEPKTVSTRMLLVGLNAKDEVEAYQRASAHADWVVADRPVASAGFWEFK